MRLTDFLGLEMVKLNNSRETDESPTYQLKRLRRSDIIHSTTMLIGMVLAALASSFLYSFTHPDMADDAASRISRLDDAKRALQDLSSFVDDQRQRLVESEKTLSQLNAEKSKLASVVAADRKTVDAVLAIYQERTRADAWWDKLFGFFVGVASSLAASVIWLFVSRRRSRKRVSPRPGLKLGAG